mmetsp:Transcript_19834/g.40110  ORF Transcript_19834/g.40110 Transcript_19834/m.40110 type:complete len:226 (+) Transcript_19834:398-1075(+)
MTGRMEGSRGTISCASWGAPSMERNSPLLRSPEMKSANFTRLSTVFCSCESSLCTNTWTKGGRMFWLTFKRTASWYKASVDRASIAATTSSRRNSRIILPFSENTNRSASRTAPLFFSPPLDVRSRGVPSGLVFPPPLSSFANVSRFCSRSTVCWTSNSPSFPNSIYLKASLILLLSSVSRRLAIYGYAESMIAKSGSPTRAIPSRTPIARMIRAKKGGMRNGNS